MRIATLSRASRRRGPLGRAATMIEFAMVLPIFLFMMIFSIDMGVLMLTAGSMSDTAFSAARAGAQAGGGAWDSENGGYFCTGPCTPGAGVSSDVVYDADSLFPLSESVRDFDPSQMRISSGAQCVDSGPDSFVTVEMSYRVHFLTPGLSVLVGVISDEQDSGMTLNAVGVARCEIAR